MGKEVKHKGVKGRLLEKTKSQIRAENLRQRWMANRDWLYDSAHYALVVLAVQDHLKVQWKLNKVEVQTLLYFYILNRPFSVLEVNQVSTGVHRLAVHNPCLSLCAKGFAVLVRPAEKPKILNQKGCKPKITNTPALYELTPNAIKLVDNLMTSVHRLKKDLMINDVTKFYRDKKGILDDVLSVKIPKK